MRSKDLKNKLKVSGNSKKLRQLQLHTIKVIVIVIVIEKTITITLLPISDLLWYGQSRVTNKVTVKVTIKEK